MTLQGPHYYLQNADRLIGLGMPVHAKPGGVAYQAKGAYDAIEWARLHVTHNNVRAAIAISNAWQEEHAEDMGTLRAGMGEVDRAARTDQNTLVERAEPMCRAFVSNLKRIRHWVSDVDSPMRGEPAFLVGAGSSLNRNVHLMEEAATKGYVFAVNTSCGPVRDHCDAVLTVESKDVTSGIGRGPETLHLLEVTAGAVNWEHPCERQLAFAAHDPPVVEHVLRMGGLTTPYGGTCLSAAFSIAYAWGADPIVLVGSDLAFLEDGMFYAEGTPFEDIRWRQEENRIVFSGQSKEIPDQTAVIAPSWGQGTTLTSTYMLDFARHLSHLSQKVLTINASEGGVHLPGTHEYTLRETLDKMETIDKRPIPTPREVSPAMEIARVRRGLQAIIDAEDPHWPLREVPLMALMAVPEITRMNAEGGLNPRQRRDRMTAHVHKSACELMELL